MLFAENGSEFTLLGEQFWGRAARASKTRKSLGRSLNFGANFDEWLRAGRREIAPLVFWCGDRQFVEIMKLTVM